MKYSSTNVLQENLKTVFNYETFEISSFSEKAIQFAFHLKYETINQQ